MQVSKIFFLYTLFFFVEKIFEDVLQENESRKWEDMGFRKGRFNVERQRIWDNVRGRSPGDS